MRLRARMAHERHPPVLLCPWFHSEQRARRQCKRCVFRSEFEHRRPPTESLKALSTGQKIWCLDNEIQIADHFHATAVISRSDSAHNVALLQKKMLNRGDQRVCMIEHDRTRFDQPLSYVLRHPRA